MLPLYNRIVRKAVGVDWHIYHEARSRVLVVNELSLFSGAGFSLISGPLECLAPNRIGRDIESKRFLVSKQGLDVTDDNVFITRGYRNRFLLCIALVQLKSCKPVAVGRLDKGRYFGLGNPCIPRKPLDSGMIGDVSRHKRVETALAH